MKLFEVRKVFAVPYTTDYNMRNLDMPHLFYSLFHWFFFTLNFSPYHASSGWLLNTQFSILLPLNPSSVMISSINSTKLLVLLLLLLQYHDGSCHTYCSAEVVLEVLKIILGDLSQCTSRTKGSTRALVKLILCSMMSKLFSTDWISRTGSRNLSEDYFIYYFIIFTQ